MGLLGGGGAAAVAPGCFLLAALALLQPGASAPLQGSHRVLVRFAEPHAASGSNEVLRRRVRELEGRPGVAQAAALEHVGLAIATCHSLDAEERLLRELEEDPEVELATPDTWVRFDGAVRGSAAKSGKERPLEDLRQCSAQSGCAALGLVGQCCPAADGLMLACCDGRPTQDLVAFRSFHGRYLVAEEGGAVYANRLKADAWETFQVLYNSDGTISLRSHFGRYVGADGNGVVNARSGLIHADQKFTLISNKDSTISLKSSHSKYVAAELDGRLSANRDKIGDWEKFVMKDLSSPSQRFPNDANFTALWGMHELLDKDIDAPEAWKTFTGEFSAGIIVAVIDTGIDYEHEDLRDNMWVSPGEIPGNGVDDDGNGFVDDVHGADFANGDGDPMDDQMHGTHCAGTIAGVGNNGVGVTGVAWHGVRLMALKFLTASGDGKTSDAVRALDYAVAHGAKVVSNSWGGGASSAALRLAIERSEAAGVLFVAAAGNSHADNDASPHYPSSYAVGNILSVASTTSRGELSGFSCYGAKSVDLAAPGSRIYSTVPHNAYEFLSGTSMATPHVSGLAALIWMYRPSLSMRQVKDILMSTVKRTEALEGRVLTGGRINAQRALEAASAAEPPYPPVHAPKAVAFADVDPKVGLIGGSVTITAASDESDVLYYKVYFVSSAGYQLDAVGSVNATGAKVLEVPIGRPRSLPRFAAGLVAVSGNATGEMPAQIGGRSPNCTVDDFAVPEGGPRAVEWGGDVDARKGVVAGTLRLTRAADEASVSQYNVYWSNASGTRGPLLGSVPASGFRLPRCRGRSCPLINVTEIAGGSAFHRGSYGDGEEASIEASGPAMVSITRFDTEGYYDTLTVGSQELSGTPHVPMKLTLPEGPLAIKWASDESVTASGWAFELVQTGATAEFRVPASAPLGRGLEVVAAYGRTELPKGVFVKVVDYDAAMPPSPAFAPLAVRFTDLDNASGAIRGVVEVQPALGAVTNGGVSYYQLDFADGDGNALGWGGRAAANGSRPVLIRVAAAPLPKGASKLFVRAGNAFGLSTGGATADLQDAPARSSPAEASPHLRRPSGGQAPRRGLFEATRAGKGPEPWLPPAGAVEEQRTVWPARPSALLSAGPAAAASHILCAVTLPGVDARTLAGQQARGSLQGAILAALPHVGPESVAVTRILAKAPAAPAGRGPSATRKAVSAAVEFRVEPGREAPAHALDRIEARLIQLGLGGRSAERLNEELVARLVAASVPLPAGVRSQVGPPQQMAGGRPGRALSAAALPAAVDDGPPSALDGLRGEERTPLVAGVSLLAAALASAAALALRGRGRLPEKALGGERSVSVEAASA